MPLFAASGTLIKQTLSGMIRLLYPSLCAGCGNDLPGTQQLICLECIDKLPVTDFHRHENNPVEKMFRGRLPLANASAYLYFTKNSLVQNLLHEFKYKSNKEIGLYFGRRMGELFQQSENYNHIDALIPLPLFFKKERKRGYNQAAIICNGIAEVMHAPVLQHAVRRITATQTQTHKNRAQRWTNIEGKFELSDQGLIENKHVLLVDDVITTGATLEACGMELIKARGLLLSIAALAYTSL